MRRTFVFIIAAAIILTVIAVILTYVSNRRSTESNVNGSGNENIPLDQNTNTVTVNSAQTSEQAAAVSLARTFAEQYGSWTPASLTSLFDEIAPRLTDTFSAEARSTHESATAPAAVLSIASQALSTTVRSFIKDTSATVDVVMSRTEQRTGQASIQYYETLIVGLVFKDGNWLIHSAVWTPSRVQPGDSSG